jgi:ectoine hydroxylase-related dioxygenase (phytanoyl-CoA dioxygenase family)
MSTTPSEIHQFFHENGYYHAKGVFNPAEVYELEIDFDRIVRQLTGSGEEVTGRWSGAATDKIAPKDSFFVHTHNVQIYSAAWLRALLHARFQAYSQAILGPDVILHHSKLFQKPAEKGAPFPMHQDWSYFPSVQDTMMAGIIHVSEATDEMGCLRVYPGSHKLGRKAESNGQGSSDDNWLKDYPIEKATVVEAEPGDVLFFHYFTLHGSMPNRSQKLRKTVLVQMHAGTDRIEDDNTHPNARLTLSGWNHYAKRSLGNVS